MTHREMLAFTALDADEIEARILDHVIGDVVSAALALAWAKVRQRATVSLVSGGITAEETRALGFHPFGSLDAALEDAFQQYGSRATVIVLTHAPDMLPLVGAHA